MYVVAFDEASYKRANHKTLHTVFIIRETDTKVIIISLAFFQLDHQLPR